MSSRRNGPLYPGVTSNLPARVRQHQKGHGADFSRDDRLFRLAYAACHETITTAIQRERSIKRWPRACKVRLIHLGNPAWLDLSGSL